MTYIGLLITGAILTALMFYPVRWLALRVGAISYPGGRSVHRTPTPLLGGLAIFVSCIAIVSGLFLLHENTILMALLEKKQQLFGLLLGSSIIVALGVWDDIHNISARYKLMGQMLAAALMVFFGFTIKIVSLPTMGNVELGILGHFVFILWVVGITNAVNLIDGLDGLASVTCLAATIGNGIIAIQTGNVFIGFFAFLLAGCLLGFLFHNFPPARIFLGDTGSMLIGFLLAVTVISGSTQKRSTVIMVLAPLLLLGFSLLDVVVSIIRRFIRGKPVFSADAGHIHHKLMLHFKNPRRVLVVVGFFSFLTTCAAIFLNNVGYNSVWFWVILAGLLVLLVVFMRLLGYFRVGMLREVLFRRRDVKFLYSFLSYGSSRLKKATSMEVLYETLTLACKDLEISRLRLEQTDGELLFQWTHEQAGDGETVYAHERTLCEECEEGPLEVYWTFKNEHNQEVKGDKNLVWWEFIQTFATQWNRLAIQPEEMTGDRTSRSAKSAKATLSSSELM